jgi:predicted PurR-regulated permease PerM
LVLTTVLQIFRAFQTLSILNGGAMDSVRPTPLNSRPPVVSPGFNPLPWVLIAVVLMGGWWFREILMLLGAAFGLAWVLAPAVDWLHQRRVPRAIAIAMVLVASGVVATLLLWIAVPDIVENISTLAANVPQRAQRDWLPAITRGLVWLRRRFHLHIPVTTDAWISQIAERATSLAQGSLTVVASAANASLVVLEKAVNILIVLALAFYTLSGWHGLTEGITAMVPMRARLRFLDVMTKIDQTLGRFVRGQFLVMAILGTIFAIGLGTLHVPAGVGLGIFAGLIAFVPYLGFFIALGIATLLAELDNTGHCSVKAVIVFMVIVHLADILVISPRILGKSTGLSPMVIIVSLLAGAHALGFLGLLVAVPAAAVIKVLLDELVDWYKSTRFYSSVPIGHLDTQSTVDTSLPSPRLTLAPPEDYNQP